MFKRGKGRKNRKTKIIFLSIFANFDSTKSIEDSWLLCIHVMYGDNCKTKYLKVRECQAKDYLERN